jgi:hypothetical protein
MNEIVKKGQGNRNALTHGIFSRDLLLPWDSAPHFERLHEDLRAEFLPQGRAEDEIVLDLACLHWQKHTLWRMRPLAVLKDPFTQDILQTERKSWSGIRKRLRAAAKSEKTLLGTVEAQCAKMFGKIKRFRKEMEATSDREAVKLIEDKINALMRVVSDHVLPLLEKLKQGPTAEQAFDNAYAVDDLEKIVRLEAALDTRISKVLARLVALKEYKRTPAARGTAITLTGPDNLKAQSYDIQLTREKN